MSLLWQSSRNSAPFAGTLGKGRFRFLATEAGSRADGGVASASAAIADANNGFDLLMCRPFAWAIAGLGQSVNAAISRQARMAGMQPSEQAMELRPEVLAAGVAHMRPASRPSSSTRMKVGVISTSLIRANRRSASRRLHAAQRRPPRFPGLGVAVPDLLLPCQAIGTVRAAENDKFCRIGCGGHPGKTGKTARASAARVPRV